VSLALRGFGGDEAGQSVFSFGSLLVRAATAGRQAVGCSGIEQLRMKSKAYEMGVPLLMNSGCHGASVVIIPDLVLSRGST